MQRLFLSVLRFCLSAWVGIAVFFFVLLVELRKWEPFTLEMKDEHPKVLFPLFYRFEFALLLPALVCAGASLWNRNMGRGRRIAVLQLVIIAVALAIWDFGLIYQKLGEMLAMGRPYPVEFQALHKMSKWLNQAIVLACTAATVLTLFPERAHAEPASPKA
jgi:hypothetical protein